MLRKEKYSTSFYITIFLAIANLVNCFLPWISFKSNGKTFTGFKTEKFLNGVSYGQPGYMIWILVCLFLILVFLNFRHSKKIALFIVAILVAYCIRTYMMFISSLFEGEIIKHAGIYLELLLPILLLAAALFPKRTPPKPNSI